MDDFEYAVGLYCRQQILPTVCARLRERGLSDGEAMRVAGEALREYWRRQIERIVKGRSL